jgi:hypothetical protein
VLLQVQDLGAQIALKEAGLRLRNEMEVGPTANRFKSKIRTATRLSCSILLAIEELQATGLTSQRVFVDMRPQKLRTGLCQNFYEAACQVARPVREIDIAFRHTPS